MGFDNMGNTNIDEENRKIIKLVTEKVKEICHNKHYEFTENQSPVIIDLCTGEINRDIDNIGGDDEW